MGPLTEGSGRELCPLRMFVDFEAQNGEFWCILGALVYSSAACFTCRKLVLLALDNLQQLHSVHCMHAEEQKAKYACSQL